MPVQNPLTRIEQVALDLGRLADEIGDLAGARRTFLYLRSELLASLNDIQRASVSNERESAAIVP
jgi:hypothetical protein